MNKIRNFSSILHFDYSLIGHSSLNKTHDTQMHTLLKCTGYKHAKTSLSLLIKVQFVFAFMKQLFSQ